MPLARDVFQNIQQTLNDTPGEPTTFLKDSRTAARMWGTNNANLDRLPRSKFLFFVNFQRGDAAGTVTRYGDWTTGVSFLIKSTTRPGFNFKTETLNQYNKKRVIQTGIEYQPITIDFYDTYDQRVIQMMREYLVFYYGDFRAARTSWNYDVVAEQFDTAGIATQSGDFGFNPPQTLGNEAYFFSNMEIYQFGGGKFSKVTLINPKIQSFDYDNEDYSDATGPQMIKMTFMYEGVVFEDEFTPVGNAAGAYGLDLGEYNNVFFPGYVPNPSRNLSTQLNATGTGANISNTVISTPGNPGQQVYLQNPENNNPSYINAVSNGTQLAFNPNTVTPNINLNNPIDNINIRTQQFQALQTASSTGMIGRRVGDRVRAAGQNITNRFINRIFGGLG